MPNVERHRILDHDLYRVETRGGERVWLEIPRGTPTRVRTTRLPQSRRAPVAVAA